MQKLKIQTGQSNSILRTLSEPIKSQEIRKYKSLALEMVKHIKDPENGGVGLAAPQVGYNKRLIVVSLMKDYDDENYRTIPMINPEIIENSGKKCSDKEGCLSVPGETGSVERWTWVRVNFLDIEGKKYSLKLEDLAARIVQHEIDHLDGVLFTDKVVGGVEIVK
ncbi:MAG: peptide deformylase [Candidatus Altimarinota bacterium]